MTRSQIIRDGVAVVALCLIAWGCAAVGSALPSDRAVVNGASIPSAGDNA